jgi:nucleotide-binding universal stress UspA family protein
VIVLKDEALDSPVGPEHRVVVGTDGSPEAAAAVSFAAARAVTASATLQVITCTGEHQIENVDERELRASAIRIAEDAADGVREAHHELIVKTRVDDSTAELASTDASTDAGPVVVGTRGRVPSKGSFSAQ